MSDRSAESIDSAVIDSKRLEESEMLYEKLNETETDLEKLSLDNLSKELGSKDWKTRKNARVELEKKGHVSTDTLVKILKNGSEDARWEAAKALIAIKDSAAAPALVEAFHDESFEIRWMAAEALIAMESACVPALMRALERYPQSQPLRQGAHHVLSDLERHGMLRGVERQVLDNLRMIGPWEHISFLAEHAMERPD